MPSFKIRSFVLLVVVGLVAFKILDLISPNLFVDRPGYCSSKSVSFSDVQFISAAKDLLEENMARSGVLVGPDGSRKLISYRDTVYKGWAPFDANCCAIDRANTYGLVRRIFKAQEVIVYVKKFDDGPIRFSDNKFKIKYSICGRFLESDIVLVGKNLTN
ncbi:hypothetical protein [Pseudomonas viridiflava]|uniref:hypothetical protein n=1 Tax=Pseudomonas viridiflava TaxID=33069 RepID=UPI000F0456CD|nr:hypothetical protein [Pseudomonas viridiflava]